MFAKALNREKKYIQEESNNMKNLACFHGDIFLEQASPGHVASVRHGRSLYSKDHFTFAFFAGSWGIYKPLSAISVTQAETYSLLLISSRGSGWNQT